MQPESDFDWDEPDPDSDEQFALRVDRSHERLERRFQETAAGPSAEAVLHYWLPGMLVLNVVGWLTAIVFNNPLGVIAAILAGMISFLLANWQEDVYRKALIARAPEIIVELRIDGQWPYSTSRKLAASFEDGRVQSDSVLSEQAARVKATSTMAKSIWASSMIIILGAALLSGAGFSA